MKNILFFLSFSITLLISCKEELITPIPESTATWEKVANLPGDYLYLQIKGSSIYMVCYKDEYKFAVSQDSGKHWQVSNLGFLPNYTNGFLSVEGSTFFISGYDGLFKSTDSGSTWNEDIELRSFINPIFSIPCLFDISVNGDTVLLGQLKTDGMGGHVKGVIISLDGGISWYCPNQMETPWRVVAIEKVGLILLCSDNGVKYYDFQINTWQNSTGLSVHDSEIYDFVKIGSRVYGVSIMSIKYSDVSGCSWLDCNLMMDPDEIIIPFTFATNSSKLFLLSTKKKIYSTNRSNFNWKALESELPAFDPFPYENQTLFTLGDDYLYYISNNKLWKNKITE